MASKKKASRVDFDVKTLPTGVVEITFREGRFDWERVARCVGIGRNVYLLANFRRANLSPPEGSPPEADCFLRAPREIRETDSLHLFTLDCSKSKPPLVSALAAADAGMTVFSDQEGESLMAGQQILWAWFARPSLLLNQLMNGSADLAARLLELPQIVLFETTAGALSIVTLPTLVAGLTGRLSEDGAGPAS